MQKRWNEPGSCIFYLSLQCLCRIVTRENTGSLLKNESFSFLRVQSQQLGYPVLTPQDWSLTIIMCCYTKTEEDVCLIWPNR